MNVKELVMKHEGLRTKVYKDSRGILTIGYGRNLEGEGITGEEAIYLLHNDLDRVYNECCKAFDWFEALDDTRKAVVMDMVFNLGLAGFEKFENTIDFISKGLWEDAGDEMLNSAWAKEVGNRATELSELMKKGE